MRLQGIYYCFEKQYAAATQMMIHPRLIPKVNSMAAKATKLHPMYKLPENVVPKLPSLPPISPAMLVAKFKVVVVEILRKEECERLLKTLKYARSLLVEFVWH